METLCSNKVSNVLWSGVQKLMTNVFLALLCCDCKTNIHLMQSYNEHRGLGKDLGCDNGLHVWFGS